MHSHFLVSCVGAYHDSGFGTGAFVSINNKKISVIDHLDCTGLWLKDGICFRFVRSLKSLLFYDKNGLKGYLRLPEVIDVHDILISDNEIICVSTGTNEILYFDFLGVLKKRWKADGTDDAWHLNCITIHEEKLYMTAFGEFMHHREWNEKGVKEKGFLMEVDSKKIIINSLSGPHHPRFIDNKWLICNSHKSSLRVVGNDGSFEDIELGGFTRGINFDDNYIYVGVNANRKDPTSTNASIKVLHRKTFKLLDSIAIPFPEIYDIVLADKDFIENIEKNTIAFTLNGENNSRIKALENQVRLGLMEIEKSKIQNQKLREDVKINKRSLLERALVKVKYLLTEKRI